MSESFRFFPEVIRIVNGALRLDVDKVRNYTAFLAQKVEESGDASTAQRLRKLLEETDTQLRPAEARFARALPVDADSRFPLVEQVKLKHLQEPPLHLQQPQWDVVNEFVSVAKSHTTLGTADTTGALSFLMYGPPGTGKSRLARHIARELGLDLYVARLDGLISSFLGSTSKNIRALFDFAAKTPCVLFLDEFDAIAKLRGDAQELGELKRVVNSFLQNLDTLGRQSIILAATNHDDLLDAAVWRRFTYRLALQLPSGEQRAQMWQDFLPPGALQRKELLALAELSEGFSGSDIHEASTRLKRRALAHNQPLRLRDALPVVQNLGLSGQGSAQGQEGRLASQLSGLAPAELARQLHERNPKLFSFAMLGELLGLSKATVYRYATHGSSATSSATKTKRTTKRAAPATGEGAHG